MTERVTPDQAASQDLNVNESNVDEPDLPEQMRIRRAKRRALLDRGIEPYPVGFEPTATIAEIRERYVDMPMDTATGERASVSGRVMFFRNTGKLCFATIQSGAGEQLQVMLSLAKVGEESLSDWKSLVDIGDHLGVEGEVITSKRGELSILVDRWVITAKSLRPLPVAHRPMSEESRVRQRYVDLIMRGQARDVVRQRAAVVRSLRESFHQRNFVEVETPMLQVLHGGATARPFVTHINAYDIDVYLRIAPELYLKRCLVGGIENVFEINRNFRNEGADSSHSPEFSMLEFYQAYGNYNSMAELTRKLIQEAAQAVFGSLTVTHDDGSEHDFSGEWRSTTLYGSVSEKLGEEVTPSTSRDQLVRYMEKQNLTVDPLWSSGQIVEELFEELVVPELRAPTFVRDYPVETSPLTRQHREQPGLAEKWDLYVNGFELGTGYTELADPVIQRERLVSQSLLAAKGDPEAMQLDEDFLRAMEHGMPPAGGVGMGIDRLLMSLTGLGMRDTIPFPLVRPQ